MLPRGHYTSYVYVTDGTLVAAQGAAFDMDAFVIKLNDATPKRGQSITITATTAELLSKSPTLFIYQPRLARWSVRMSKVSGHTYRITIRLKSSGGTGQGLVPGQGPRHQGRRAVHAGVVPAALTRPGCPRTTPTGTRRSRQPRRHPTAPDATRSASDRPSREPHQTAPDHPVPSRTGTIEP